MKKISFINLVACGTWLSLQGAAAPAMTITNLQPSATFFVFCHSLNSNAKQAKYYTRSLPDESHRPWFILNHSVVSFDFPDTDLNPRKSNRNKTTLGQAGELRTIDHIVRETTSSVCKNRNGVMVGVSRGAVASINYCALYKPQHIKALIIESPFDHIDNAIAQRVKNSHCSWIPGINKVGSVVFPYFYPKHQKNGPQPINVIAELSKDLPILLVHSKQDKVTPVTCSHRLINILKQAGHQHVYFLELDQGAHAKLHLSDNAKLYQEVAHAFLAKYEFAHDPELAKAGKEYLEKCKIVPA